MDNIRQKSKEFIADLLFPKYCLGCQKEGTYLCEDCLFLLDINEFSYCLCDKNPVIMPPLQNQGKCPKCKQKELAGLYFALPYKDSALTKKLIHQFKYPPYLKDLAKTMAGILVEYFIKTDKNKNEIWQDSVLVPVPIGKRKLKSRGYNQSEELAEELSKILKIPAACSSLIKIKATKAQMESTKLERESNLKGAFLVKNPENILKKKVFLVDDVYTTGSTMQECAIVLKKAGAKSVWGVCIAREG